MKKIIIIFPSMLLLLLSFSFMSKNKVPSYDLRYVEKNLAFIPAGTCVIGDPSDTAKSKNVGIEAFYIFNQEVSNGLYGYYLKEIRKTGDQDMYVKALPDTTVWRTQYGHMEPYVEYYFRHPAYAGYPLVGISYKQCLGFCQWLTNTYNKWPERKFKKVTFNLPDSVQWQYAASGGDKWAELPWKGYEMRNARGEWLANFKAIPQVYIRRTELETTGWKGEHSMETFYISNGRKPPGLAGSPNDWTYITAPVHSYWPNVNGLYNMAGNVEEFICPEGYTKGGSWRDPGYYLLNRVTEKYDPAKQVSTERGFRFIMKVMEE